MGPPKSAEADVELYKLIRKNLSYATTLSYDTTVPYISSPVAFTMLIAETTGFLRLAITSYLSLLSRLPSILSVSNCLLNNWPTELTNVHTYKWICLTIYIIYPSEGLLFSFMFRNVKCSFLFSLFLCLFFCLSASLPIVMGRTRLLEPQIESWA